jgi:hypothetical protein
MKTLPMLIIKLGGFRENNAGNKYSRIAVPTFVAGFSCCLQQGIGGVEERRQQVPGDITIGKSIPNMQNRFGEIANTGTMTGGSVA